MAVVSKTLLGALALAGSAVDTYVGVASPLTANVQQNVVRVSCETTAGVVDFTLPEISEYAGKYGDTQIIVFDAQANALANNITVRAAGTDTIEGAATHVINVNSAAVTFLVSSAGTWVVVA